MPDPAALADRVATHTGLLVCVLVIAALWLWATRHGRRHVWGGPEPSTLRDVRREGREG